MSDGRNGERRTPSEGAEPQSLFEPDRDGARSGPPAGPHGVDASPPSQVAPLRSARQPSSGRGGDLGRREAEKGSLGDRFSSLPVRTLLLLAVVGFGVVAVLGVIAALLSGPEPAPAAAPPAPAPAVDIVTTQPGVPAAVQVPDGPAPDVGPFGIDGQALLEEVASHQVPLQQTDQQTLVDIGNRAVARDVPDLPADDPQIRSDLQAAFPGWSEQNYVDATRCAAEYAERLIARNDGTVPPDSDDHHGGG